MRSEEQILGLIVNTARSDDRIRAAILSGSRANPDARRDIFQDFDVAYFVTDVDSFRNDPVWIRRFGEIMIVQMPEAMEDPPGRNDGRFVYLMQFTDGNRIDLTLLPVARLHQGEEEIRGVVLLDKDRVLESNPVPGESDRLAVPPTASAFSDCCNEFWWVCTYVAKGLWRREIIYAKFMLDQAVRAQLMKMLTWYVGVKTAFSKGPGHFGRNLEQHLEPELWAMLEKTYSDAGYENTWNALDTMCDLFRVTADHVAAYCGLDYPRSDDENVTAHLKHVRLLPAPKKFLYAAVVSVDVNYHRRMTLVWPSREFLAGYVAALQRGWSADNLRGRAAADEELRRIASDPDAFLASRIDREARGGDVTLPNGTTVPRLPGYYCWLWDGEFCGAINFRWQPGTEALPRYCLGHIGYSVVPWKQGRGYATRALAEILQDARAEGLHYVEITTTVDNIASQRVIEHNGGVRVEEFVAPAELGGRRHFRYRVYLLRTPA